MALMLIQQKNSCLRPTYNWSNHLTKITTYCLCVQGALIADAVADSAGKQLLKALF